jgi:hypothetical protein
VTKALSDLVVLHTQHHVSMHTLERQYLRSTSKTPHPHWHNTSRSLHGRPPLRVLQVAPDLARQYVRTHRAPTMHYPCIPPCSIRAPHRLIAQKHRALDPPRPSILAPARHPRHLRCTLTAPATSTSAPQSRSRPQRRHLHHSFLQPRTTIPVCRRDLPMSSTRYPKEFSFVK